MKPSGWPAIAAFLTHFAHRMPFGAPAAAMARGARRRATAAAVAAAAVLLVARAPVASATVIFDNTAGMASLVYSPTQRAEAGCINLYDAGGRFGSFAQPGVLFQAAASAAPAFYVTNVTLPLQPVSSTLADVSAFQLTLYADDGSVQRAPGARVATSTVAIPSRVLPTGLYTWVTVDVTTAAATWTLSPAGWYWVALEPPAGTTINLGSVDVKGMRWGGSAGNGTATAPGNLALLFSQCAAGTTDSCRDATAAAGVEQVSSWPSVACAGSRYKWYGGTYGLIVEGWAASPSPTSTSSPSQTATSTSTSSETSTGSGTPSSTATQSASPSTTASSTATPSATASVTPSRTPPPSHTATRTPSTSRTPSRSALPPSRTPPPPVIPPTISLIASHAIGALDVRAARNSSRRGGSGGVGVPLWLPVSVPFRAYGSAAEDDAVAGAGVDNGSERLLLQWPLYAPLSGASACAVVGGNVSVDLVGLASADTHGFLVRLRHGGAVAVLLNGTGSGRRVGALRRDGDYAGSGTAASGGALGGMPRQWVEHVALQQPVRVRSRLRAAPPVWRFGDLTTRRRGDGGAAAGCGPAVNLTAGATVTASGSVVGGDQQLATDGVTNRVFSAGGAAVAVPSTAALLPPSAGTRSAWLEVDLGAAAAAPPNRLAALRLWTLDVADRDAQPEVQTVTLRALQPVAAGSYRLSFALPGGANATTAPIDLWAAPMRDDAPTHAAATGSVQAAVEAALPGVLATVTRAPDVNSAAASGLYTLTLTLHGGGNVPQVAVPPSALSLLTAAGYPAAGAAAVVATLQDGAGNARLDGSGDAVSVFPRCMRGAAACEAAGPAAGLAPAWLLLTNASLGDATLEAALSDPSVLYARRLELPEVADSLNALVALPAGGVAGARYVRLQRSDADGAPLVVAELEAFAAAAQSVVGPAADCPPSLAAYTGPARVPPGDYPSHSSLRVFDGAPVDGPWLLEVVAARRRASGRRRAQQTQPVVAQPTLSVSQRIAALTAPARGSGGDDGAGGVTTVAGPHDRHFGSQSDHAPSAAPAGYLSAWSLSFDCGSGGSSGRVTLHADAQVCLHTLPAKGDLTIATTAAATHADVLGMHHADGAGSGDRVACDGSNAGSPPCRPEGLRDVATGDGAAAWSGDAASYALTADGTLVRPVTTAAGDGGVLTYASTRHVVRYTPRAGETGPDALTYTVALGVPGGVGGAGAQSCGAGGAIDGDVSVVQLELRAACPGSRSVGSSGAGADVDDVDDAVDGDGLCSMDP